MDQKILMTDQSPNMALTTNRESTNEVASPMKFIPDNKSKDFTGERSQVVKSTYKNYNIIDKINRSAFTESKMLKKCLWIPPLVNQQKENRDHY